jgi:phasin
VRRKKYVALQQTAGYSKLMLALKRAPAEDPRKEEANMSNTPFEVPTDLRDFAERSVEQARKAFEGYVSVAQKAAGAVDTASTAMHANVKSASSQALGYAEKNINAAFDLAHKLVKARDPQEAFSLQSEYLKTQIAALQEQAKEIGALIQKSASPRSE